MRASRGLGSRAAWLAAAVAVAFCGMLETASAAGRMTISGSASGYAEIDLAAPTDKSELASSWRLEGRGDLFGAFLREVPSGLSPPRFPLILGFMRTEPGVICQRPCEGEAAAPMTEIHFGGHLATFYSPVLPAGRYRLYLVADGAPVRSSFTLPELAGDVSLQPEVPVSTEAVAPELVPMARPDPGIGLMGGAHRELLSEGMLWIASGYDSPQDYQQAVEDLCIHWGPQDPEAYEEDCPGSKAVFTSRFDHGASEGGDGGTGSARLVAFAVNGPGTYGLGGNVRISTEEPLRTRPRINMRTAWIEFERTARDADPVGGPVAPWGGRPGRLRVVRVGRPTRGRARIRVRCLGQRGCVGILSVHPRGRRKRIAVPAGGTRTIAVRVGGRACEIELGTRTARERHALRGRRCRSRRRG